MDKFIKKKQRVIYLGNFVDDAIVAERGLPFRNAAGSNRMERIAQALKTCGFLPVILSPAISMRARKEGPLIHQARLRLQRGIPIIFAPALNVPILNVFTSFFFQLACLRTIIQNDRIEGVVIYNFNPSLVIICVYLKYLKRLTVLNNVEDIYTPCVHDWTLQSEARAIQETIYSFCLKLVSRIADGYIVPTKRFLDYLPETKPFSVVTGCIKVEKRTAACNFARDKGTLQVLFAGKIAREHGIVEFIQALRKLDHMDEPPSLQVDICGYGGMDEWLHEQIGTITTVRVMYHGFIPFAEYNSILSRADVCLALQNPDGRYANFKTPSKVYEFLGNGKAVITTKVGDFLEMPEDSILLLDRLDALEIAGKLLLLYSDRKLLASLQASARRHAIDNFSYSVVGKIIKNLLRICASRQARKGGSQVEQS